MNTRSLSIVLTVALGLAAVSAAGKKPGGDGRPGDPQKAATQYAVFAGADVQSFSPVEVGINVWTYSPEPIQLTLSAELVGDNLQGVHVGKARVLKKNGSEGGRLDFVFDCTGEPESCEYQLVVRGGTYNRKTDAVVYELGTDVVLASKTGGLLKHEEAANVSFTIQFQE